MKKKTIRVFTAFSGYDSQMMALRKLQKLYPQYRFVLVGWCEIDQPVINSHNAVFPKFAVECSLHSTSCKYKGKHHRDIKKIKWNKVPNFDMLFYSSCCQSVSLTGAMEGMEEGSGTQSALIWFVLDAIKERKPKYCILENVKNMASTTFIPSFEKWKRSVSKLGYRNYAMVLNSSDYGVPQNRERLFMVSIRDDVKQDFQFPAPVEYADADMISKDYEKKETHIVKLLEQEPLDKEYYYNQQEVVKYIHAIFEKNIDESVIANVEDLSGGRLVRHTASLTCNSRNGYWVIPTLKATGYGKGTYKNFSSTGYFPQTAVLEVWEKDAPIGFNYLSLIDNAVDSGEEVTNASQEYIQEIVKSLQSNQYLRLRKMTPREQFRFMGVPEEYIDRLLKSGNNNDELYKQAGNSIVVDVLYHLFASLFNINTNKIKL